MNGQTIGVLIIVALAVAYLIWRFLQARRPGAKAQGGCGCCAATCAAKQIGQTHQTDACAPVKSPPSDKS